MKRKKNNLKTKLLLTGLILFLAAAVSDAQTNQAYGNNMKLIDSTLVGSSYQYIFAIYSGDVNQDGKIDAADFNYMETDVLNFSTGYINSDVNGDGKADAADFNLLEKNVLNFVEVAHP